MILAALAAALGGPAADGPAAAARHHLQSLISHRLRSLLLSCLPFASVILLKDWLLLHGSGLTLTILLGLMLLLRELCGGHLPSVVPRPSSMAHHFVLYLLLHRGQSLPVDVFLDRELHALGDLLLRLRVPR